jgi:putative nucleotidyltransferase with HDIG domain
MGENPFFEINTELIPLLLEVMENKDQDTLLHSSRVQKILNDWAPQLVLYDVIKSEDIPVLWVAAMLHDIGKIFVKDDILISDKKLNKIEYDHIRNHPSRGYNLLRQFDMPQSILDTVLHHHERWDGRMTGKFPGYPDGLKGRDIPLFARIVAVADTFDALISERPYKKPILPDKAKLIIHSNAGKQFDPALVDIFLHSHQADKRPFPG